MNPFTILLPYDDTRVLTSCPVTGWLDAVTVEFEHPAKVPRWQPRVLRLSVNGQEVWHQPWATSVALCTFEGQSGHDLKRKSLSIIDGQTVELLIRNPGPTPMGVRVVPTVRVSERWMTERGLA